MKKMLLLLTLLVYGSISYSQTHPAITSWLQNTSGTGSYYVSGNSTAIDNGILYNCQQVEYSNHYAYITATGVPAYPTGPFLGGNPSQASNQNAIFQIPLNPQENTGTPTETTGGNIGVFINGVALFDYRDGVGWNSNTNALCGGPGNPPCPGGPAGGSDWNRDAVPAEMIGFDCSKAHPAMGNYHHHQNPSAFKLDLNVVSDICNLYDADGLYAIDSTRHSPLIGFAYDGFPIYGAYGYKNTDGTGGITRIKSGYQLRNITTRTHWADGTNVDDGPDVDATYFLGYFREDYEYINTGASDSLDEHNGRFCITPEYPAGTYAYFATVDENWNSAYPYVVGPTFYGVHDNRLVTTISEATTIYMPAPLPVEWIGFQATLKDNYVLLSWTTANEIDNDYFSLERSDNGSSFEEIGKVNSLGNTLEEQAYHYEDHQPLTGISYYRIKQTDLDGSFKYGPIISVEILNQGISELTVFPNPSSEFISIQFSGLVKNTIAVQLFDLQGRLLKTNTIEPGSTISYIDTQTLYNGEYILVLKDGLDIKVTKVMVMHD